ncbi:putative bifunctional diguanylate cyclase/phosphodiesterase [Massilia niastensis]|uniref:putative bifunctional diguanylate cyclase/phosphodiesterase n=1 Tax=Massilia niastensis TaxID=544911 RepID=UPI00036E029A|nr:bifunctional diguanylate cyclase/phosphodiesterase [Massilia niastensis]
MVDHGFVVPPLLHRVLVPADRPSALVRLGARPPVHVDGDTVLLDPPDPKLDYITRLAVMSTGTSIGGVSVLIHSQIWLPSRFGIEARILPRSGSFCSCAVQSNADWFEVRDARADCRFADNPLVTAEPHYRHYAAAPLRGGGGHLLGTLWVMSIAPRALKPEQANQLKLMARIVVDMLELRYCNAATGMFNRSVFLHHLQRLLEGRGNSAVTVGFIDLIGFRQVNDLFHRPAGDRILRLMARRLEEWGGDDALLGHLGGDQFCFALILPQEGHDEQIARLCKIIDQPFEIEEGHAQILHARIGIRRQTTPWLGDATELLDAADTAASAIRDHRGSSVVREYDSALIARSRLRYELRELIRGTSRFGRLEVHYQPQVDAAHGRLIGLEALVRWRHPVFGLVGPGMFVAEAESAGQVFELDVHVLKLVCRDLMDWRAKGLGVVPVALNFSRASLMHADILEQLAKVLEETGVPGELLEFEVTESLLVGTLQSLHGRVAALRALGVRIAIDDFGTGCSNLEALNSFPFDRLKADLQFVHGVSRDSKTAGLFSLIQGIAAVFNVELLCEGLEDGGDLEWLMQRGASHVQGWYFSRALPGDTIGQVLRRFQDAGDRALSVAEVRALLA